MEYPVYNQQGEKTEEISLPEEIFGIKVNPNLLHQVVVSQAANQRQGTAHSKTRGEVRGGGRKPWRQKGTGRARAGSIRSPLWKGGGAVFGPRNAKNYEKKINRKVARQALLMAFSGKAQDKELVVLEGWPTTALNKTRDLAKVLAELRSKKPELQKGKTLLLLPPGQANIYQLARNIDGLVVGQIRGLNALTLLSAKNVLLTRETVGWLKDFLKQD